MSSNLAEHNTYSSNLYWDSSGKPTLHNKNDSNQPNFDVANMKRMSISNTVEQRIHNDTEAVQKSLEIQSFIEEQEKLRKLELNKYQSANSKSIVNKKSQNIDVAYKLTEGNFKYLIEWNSMNNQFEIMQDAVDEINQLSKFASGGISFVSVLGEDSLQKTTLLNNILENNQDFHASRHLDEGNDGILIWTQPLYDAQSNQYIYFLDTKLKYKQQDLKDKLLFMIAILISNTVLLSNNGQLKDESLQLLMNVNDMTEFIDCSNYMQKEQLSSFIPTLFFLQNNFKRDMVEDSKLISGTQYLENFLLDDYTFMKGTTEQKTMRKKILEIFKKRECCTLPRATLDRNAKEFDNYNTSLSQIRFLIINLTKVKQHDGVFFSPQMIINFIYSLIDQTNAQISNDQNAQDQNGNQFNEQSHYSGKITRKIDLVMIFKEAVENDFITTFNECIDYYNEEGSRCFSQQMQAEYCDIETLYKVLREVREKTFMKFFNLKAFDISFAEQFFKHYKQLLLDFIIKKEKEIIETNNVELGINVMQWVTKEEHKITQKNKEGFSQEDIDMIGNEFGQITEKLKLVCLGPNLSQQAIGKSITLMQNEMFSLFKDEISQMTDGQQVNFDQLEKAMSNLKKEDDKLLNDFDKMHSDLENKFTHKGQLETEKKKLQKEITQLEHDINEDDKKKFDLSSQVQEVKRKKGIKD